MRRRRANYSVFRRRNAPAPSKTNGNRRVVFTSADNILNQPYLIASAQLELDFPGFAPAERLPLLYYYCRRLFTGEPVYHEGSICKEELCSHSFRVAASRDVHSFLDDQWEVDEMILENPRSSPFEDSSKYFLTIIKNVFYEL